MFPTFNRLKWFKGDRTSASPDIPIELLVSVFQAFKSNSERKVVSNDLARLAGLVEVFISNLRIEMTSLNDTCFGKDDLNLLKSS